MEKGIILVHYGNLNMSVDTDYIDTNFGGIYKQEWFKHPYTKRVCSVIDNVEVDDRGLLTHRTRGPMHARDLSGGAKTLIASYFMPDQLFPFRNLGDNCAQLLYEGSLDVKTQWSFHSYVPIFVPEQKFEIAHTGKIYQTDNSRKWFAWNAPDVTFVEKYLERGLPV